MRTKIIFLRAAFLLFCIASCIQAQTVSPLTFSEVMFYPAETNGEFVEIYNTSATESADLAGCKFKYSTSSNNNLVQFIGGTILRPGQYAVILQGNYDYNSGIYKSIIPAGAIVLKISTNNFGSSGMANTSNRDIFLLNAAGQTIDTYTYSADNSAGISDEKIIPAKDNSSANWKNSMRVNGTPGRKNSVSQPDYDLRINFAGMTPVDPKAEDSVKIQLLIKNNGKLTASNFSVTIFNDADNDSSGSPDEIIFTGNYSSLAAGDSLVIVKTFFAAKPTNYYFIASVSLDGDENLSNNKILFGFTASERASLKNEIVVNEIMYAPAGGEPEWIELFNRSGRNINLKNWKIGDASSLIPIASSDYLFNAGEYLIISGNASISDYYTIQSKLLIKSLPALNNSGDDVIVKSNYGATIDSLRYSGYWGGSGGRSIERINTEASGTDSTNWKTCKSKFRATPGLINSVVPRNFDLSIVNFSSSSKYAEMGKEFTLTITVINNGKSTAQNYTLKIYNDANFDLTDQVQELIGTIAGTTIASGDSALFQFKVANFSEGLNQFIARVEFTPDEYTEDNSASFKINGIMLNERRGDLVINEIMYAPVSPEQEWIEIYNASGKQINLRGYKIANHADTSIIARNEIIIHPDNYIVIAKDTSGFSKYPRIPALLIAQFPAMSNTKDKLILLDSLNRVIDSLEYKSVWGGASGKSLERINASLSSADSTNWKTGLSMNGATPGHVNSVSKKNYDLAITSFTTDPPIPIAGEKVKFLVTIKNTGKRDASFRLILNEVNADGSKIQKDEFLPGAGYFIMPGVELNAAFKYEITFLTTKKIFEAAILFDEDEDSGNNKLSLVIIPGYNFQTVLLNEVMYNPLNGEPEWIELYNNLSFDVDLENWSITDILTTPVKTKIQSGDYLFPSKSFLVIAKDSTIRNYHRVISSKIIISPFANLNNDADGVVIKDSRNNTIDSVRYDLSWGGSFGKSIERKTILSSSIDKNNWGSSKDLELSTPGRINSITPKKIDLFIKSISPEIPFPAYNEETNLAAKVMNSGTEQAGAFTVRFFLLSDDRWNYFSEGRGNSISANDSLLVISDLKLRLNETKTVMCEVFFIGDEDTLNNSLTAEIIPGLKKSSVLVNELMYDPLAGETEWIEITNVSGEPVNLKNWQISDLLPSPSRSVITSKDNFLNPGEYAVIVSDSLKYHYYPPAKFFQSKFGSLSSSDGILIYDFRGAVIDSLKYTSTWGGEKGFSLERISVSRATNDSTNWAQSICSNGATPGIENSIINIPGYKPGALTVNEIMFDPADGNSEYIEFYNASDDSIQLAGITVKIGAENKYKLARASSILHPNNYFVLAADSTIFDNYKWLKNGGATNISGTSSLSLLNDASSILIKDFYGTTLDSLAYSSDWHSKNIVATKNRSIEKLNPFFNSANRSNWNSCVSAERGTPGKQNSIYSQNLSRQSKVTVNPNPFSPDGDGYEDYTIINFDLSKPLSQVRIKVFDVNGRLVRTLAENRLAASSNSIVFDGLDDNHRPLRIGIYILLIETVSEGSGNMEIIKLPVVIARKL